jgi:GR25 family glycosyltransferase involved in LPS biosynthesis
MPIRVISLVRHAARRAEFQRRNAHVEFSFFDAVDGRTLTVDDVRSSGLFTREVEATYDAHGYGCAFSHWSLWTEAAAASEPLTILEDDVILRHDFEARQAEVLASLPADWDIVLWGWNFDSVLHVRPLDDVSPVVMLFDQKQLRASIDSFQAQGTAVQALRLEKAFGLPAYTLSPRGAARLLEQCFPLKPLTVHIPVYNRRLLNVGVDVAANAVYKDTSSWACFPPLAVTPNRRGDAGAV